MQETFLFRKGFGPFLNDGVFSDLLLVHMRKEYKVHQIILVNCSEYFSKVLQSSTVAVRRRNSREQLESVIRTRIGQISPRAGSPRPPFGEEIGNNPDSPAALRTSPSYDSLPGVSSSPTAARKRTLSSSSAIRPASGSISKSPSSPSSPSLLSPSSSYSDLPMNMKILKLSFPDPDNAFPAVLQYMYEGSIRIDEVNVVSLLFLANYLGIPDLQARLNEWLVTGLTKQNVLLILKKALELNTSDIIERCVLVLARNFSTISQSGASLCFIPPALMMTLLHHGSLTITDEFTVFQTVCRYVKDCKEQSKTETPTDRPTTPADQPSSPNQPPVTPLNFSNLSVSVPEQSPGSLPSLSSPLSSPRGGLDATTMESLFECVRFTSLKYDELEKVMKEPLVPVRLVAEALMVRLAKYEAPQRPLPTVTRLLPRSTSGRILEYRSDFDEHGVLFWIGTKGGTAKWRNPCLVERGVKVTASSIEKGDPIVVAGRKPTECWTMDVPSSWYCVDLAAHRSLLLTCYSLRHGSTSRQDCLRNWVLQGSDDGKSWQVLSRHRDEATLSSSYSTHSWPVTSCTKPFSFF